MDIFRADEAAAAVADLANQPVFFHCHHGINRTSMVQIAYRTKYCGWTLEQAADEIERTVGLVKVNHGPDYRHMVSFYENRVLPMREAMARKGRGRQGGEVVDEARMCQSAEIARRMCTAEWSAESLRSLRGEVRQECRTYRVGCPRMLSAAAGKSPARVPDLRSGPFGSLRAPE